MTYDDDYDGCVCNHCGDAVSDADVANCEPDEAGYCIFCGDYLGDEE